MQSKQTREQAQSQRFRFKSMAMVSRSTAGFESEFDAVYHSMGRWMGTQAHGNSSMSSFCVIRLQHVINLFMAWDSK